MNLIGKQVLVPFPVERPWPQDMDWSNPIFKPGTVIRESVLPEGGKFGGQAYVTCKVGDEVVGRLAGDLKTD